MVNTTAYNTVAESASSASAASNGANAPQQSCSAKARQRTLDAMLVAVLLRFTAQVLPSLTTSYSTTRVWFSLAFIPRRDTLFPLDFLRIRAVHCHSDLRVVLFLIVGTRWKLWTLVPSHNNYAPDVLSYTRVCSVRRSRATAANWLITSSVCGSTILLLLALGRGPSLHGFVAAVVGLGLVLPTWKWWIQRCKMHIRGPWDIPTAASIQLDGIVTPLPK
jgi:hypothetical protein